MNSEAKKATGIITTVLPDGVSRRFVFEETLTLAHNEVLEVDFDALVARVVPATDDEGKQ